MGYKKSAAVGVSWMWGLRFTIRVISLVRIAIIARILNPFQFGIFAIATLLLTFIETFTDTGINAFLIQEKDESKIYINSAWVVSIIRGMLISIVILSLAPFISSFFNSSSSYVSIALISLVPFLRGFINPAVVSFQKDLNFNKEFFYRTSVFAVEAIISTLFVLVFKTPEALVMGLIAGAIHEVIISNIVIERSKLLFDFSLAKKIISRGKWITAGGIFDYIFYNGDNVVVGKILGTSPLGLYDMAYTISLLPITEVGEVFARVAFPVFVKISDDLERLKKAYSKVTLYIISITLPIGLLLVLFPKEIILLILGNKWIGMVPVLQILTIFGVIRSVTNSSGAVFLAVKKQEYAMISTLVGALTLMVLIIPFVYYFGLIGAGLSAVVASVLQIPVVLYLLIKVFRSKIQ